MLVVQQRRVPYRLGADSYSQPVTSRELLIAGGSFLLGVLWGWFASQA